MVKLILKRIGSLVFICLSILFLVVTVGLLMDSEYAAAIVAFLPTLLFAYLTYKILRIKIVIPPKKVKKVLEKKEITQATVERNPLKTEIVQPKVKGNPINEDISTIISKAYKEDTKFNAKFFLHNQVQRQGIQLLESLEIIDETKNIDTLSGRIDFVNSMYLNFIKVKNKPQYLRYIQIAIDEYKAMYYNEIIKDYQLALVVNPNLINLEQFYGNAIFKAFERYEEKQQKEIEKLKTKSAIDRRYENIIKVGYSAKYLFKTFEIPDYNNNLEKIENIRKQYYNT